MTKILRRILQIFSKKFGWVALAVLPGMAGAVTVSDCGDYRSSIQSLAEPWEANTRTFAKGAIRVAVADTIEPAAGAFHLIVLHPPVDELGGPMCHVISANESFGFSGMDLGPAEASYDPATGLTILLPVGIYNDSTAGFDAATLAVTINQATGEIAAGLR